jgi:outer membrane protein assembly factor BamB
MIINKKIVFVVALLLLMPSIFSLVAKSDSGTNNTSSEISYYEKGFRYNIQGWVYIHIEGEPYERGYQYGYLASAEIVDTINRWSKFAHVAEFMDLFVIKNLPKNYDKLSEQFWKICRSRAKNMFLKAVPEEYKQEMKGIADGIKDKGEKVFGREVEFEDIVAANFIQDCMLSIKHLKYRFHPFRGIFSFSKLRDLMSFYLQSIRPGALFKNTQHLGHCSAFIATGDATKDGGIIIAQSTWFIPLIAQRCNIILDVKPSKGYRFMMTSPPGSLWSQEDFYLNEQGIVLTETEYGAKGPWKIRTPKGVRSRRAIQYSNSIDDVIKNLQDGNDGLIPNEWLIGDTKTGEIASFEQVLYNTPIKRTFNGFYASYTTPHNEKVKRELFGIISFIPSFSKKYFDMSAAGRDKKFKEIEKQYYGNIDTDIAKKILATPPINLAMTDGKITTSSLMGNMGLLAFMGNPDGSAFMPTNNLKTKFHGIKELPASGWVELYPSISKHNKLQMTVDYNDVKKTSRLLWKYETDNRNVNSSTNLISEDIVYSLISPGSIFALDTNGGKEIWNRKIEGKIINYELLDNLVIIGTDNGIFAVDKETGDIEWYQNIGKTNSKPVIVNNLVIASFSNGNLYAFDIDSGEIEWNFEIPNSRVLSEVQRDTICIGSDKTCYCFNIKDKEKLWEFKTAGKITAAPRISKNRVYIGSWDGNIYAVDLSKGDLKWTFKTGWGIDTTPTVSDGMVFVGSNDNNFYALDEKSGDLVWYFTCKSAIHSSPVVYGEYVFFGSDDGRAYALDKTNGDLAWNFAPEYSINNDDVNNYITTPILSDPVVKDGVVYISAKGNIYALDAQTTEIPKESIPEKSDSYDDLIILIIYLLLVLLGIAILISCYLKSKNNSKKI